MKNSTKYTVLAILVAFFSLSVNDASAQNVIKWDGGTIPEGYVVFDSVILHAAPSVDSTLYRVSVKEALDSTKAGVKLYQSQMLDDALDAHIEQNKNKAIPGYRVRIYFNNSKTAKTDSQAVRDQFHAAFPGVAVYRTYTNPYFKVSVGDFRTKAEALQFLKDITRRFPKAFVVKENINFPQFDKGQSVMADTVKFLRRAEGMEEQTFFDF